MMTKKIGKRKLFLETTAQIGRLTGKHEKKQKIHKILKDIFDLNIEDKEFIITSLIVYCEFLNTLVKDVLIIRNLIFNEFLQKKQFILNLSKIDERISDSSDYNINLRAKRIFKVTSALKRRFPKSETIETKRVINFLNSLAFDLAFRDFFNVRFNGNRVVINKNSSNYITEIQCLCKFPFHEGFQMNKYGKYLIEYYQNLKDENGNNICISNETITAKCDKNPIEDCGIEDFFEKEEIPQKLKKFIDESKKGLKDEPKKQKPFSSNFRKKDENKKWIEFMQNSILDDFINEFKYRGKECHRYFFDMLIALQCPEDAYILSNDKDFKELGKVIDRPDLLLNFDEWPLEN